MIQKLAERWFRAKASTAMWLEVDRDNDPAALHVIVDALTARAGWLQPPRVALLAMKAGRICGYGVARQCREGFKVGPLFADGTETALRLLAALAERMTGTLYIDVPAANSDFVAALLAAGLSPGFSTTRMYRGGAPVNAQARVFGITTLELG